MKDKMKVTFLISATTKFFILISLILVYFERLNLDLREFLFHIEVEIKSGDKKLVMTGKKSETRLFCNKTVQF